MSPVCKLAGLLYGGYTDTWSQGSAEKSQKAAWENHGIKMELADLYQLYDQASAEIRIQILKESSLLQAAENLGYRDTSKNVSEHEVLIEAMDLTCAKTRAMITDIHRNQI